MEREISGRVMMLICRDPTHALFKSSRVFHLPLKPPASSFHALHLSSWHPTNRIGQAILGIRKFLLYLPPPPPHPTKLLRCLRRHSPSYEAHLCVVRLSGIPPSRSRVLSESCLT